MNQARESIEGVIERTFHIRTMFNSGTAFVIENNDQQYLITAKHIVDGVLLGETVRLSSGLGITVVAPVEIAVGKGQPDQGGVDVAVLKVPQVFSFQSSTPALGRPEDLFVPQNIAMPTAEHFHDFGTGFGVTTRTGTIAAIVKPEHRGPYTGDLLV